MSIWGSWGNDPFAEMVEKATSENLPAGTEDIALNLDICDHIRAKKVQPRPAMRTLKARIAHKNPNVVLLALGLTDVCLKNGGEPFLLEISSREFMDSVTAMLRGSTGANHDVKSKALRLVQNWSQIAETKTDQMGAVLETYRSLKASGFDFPKRDPGEVVSAALVETMTAPAWVDGDVCMRCRTAFSTFNRKHHCRNCGNVFCQQCSSNNMPLPWYGVGQDVRVCDACYAKKGPPKPASSSTRVDALARSKSLGSGGNVAPSGRGGAARSNTVSARSGAASRRQKEEDDLALAIKLSMESAGSSGADRGGFIPSQPPAAREGRATRQADGRMLEGTDEDDDPDLAAAIAASLRDYAPPQPSAPIGLPESDDGRSTPKPLDAGSQQTRSQLPLPPSLELPASDVDAIMTFTQLASKQEELARRVGGAWSPQTTQAQQTQALYEKASSARPRMIRNFDEAKRRNGVLTSMHDKLSEAVRLYDRLLDVQMSRPTGGSAAMVPPGQSLAGTHRSMTYPEQQGQQRWDRNMDHPGFGIGQQGAYRDTLATQPQAGGGMYPTMPSYANPALQSIQHAQTQFFDRTPSRQSSASYSSYGGAMPGSTSQHHSFQPARGYDQNVNFAGRSTQAQLPYAAVGSGDGSYHDATQRLYAATPLHTPHSQLSARGGAQQQQQQVYPFYGQIASPLDHPTLPSSGSTHPSHSVMTLPQAPANGAQETPFPTGGYGANGAEGFAQRQHQVQSGHNIPESQSQAPSRQALQQFEGMMSPSTAKHGPVAPNGTSAADLQAAAAFANLSVRGDIGDPQQSNAFAASEPLQQNVWAQSADEVMAMIMDEHSRQVPAPAPSQNPAQASMPDGQAQSAGAAPHMLPHALDPQSGAAASLQHGRHPSESPSTGSASTQNGGWQDIPIVNSAAGSGAVAGMASPSMMVAGATGAARGPGAGHPSGQAPSVLPPGVDPRISASGVYESKGPALQSPAQLQQPVKAAALETTAGASGWQRTAEPSLIDL